MWAFPLPPGCIRFRSPTRFWNALKCGLQNVPQQPSQPPKRPRRSRYRGYEELQAAGLAVDKTHYEPVYTAPMGDLKTLDDIYRLFNTDHPADYQGRSVSVADVIVLQQGVQQTAYYVDTGGDYREIPEFMRENPLRTAELSTEQNENMIDGVINNTPPQPQPEEPDSSPLRIWRQHPASRRKNPRRPPQSKRLSAIIPSTRGPPAEPRKP